MPQIKKKFEIVSYKIDKQSYNLEVKDGTDYTLRDAYPCTWSEIDRWELTKSNNL